MKYVLLAIVNGARGPFAVDLMIGATYGECIAHIAELIQGAHKLGIVDGGEVQRYEIRDEQAWRLQFVHEFAPTLQVFKVFAGSMFCGHLHVERYGTMGLEEHRFYDYRHEDCGVYYLKHPRVANYRNLNLCRVAYDPHQLQWD